MVGVPLCWYLNDLLVEHALFVQAVQRGGASVSSTSAVVHVVTAGCFFPCHLQGHALYLRVTTLGTALLEDPPQLVM
jgi:hypothetical protein